MSGSVFDSCVLSSVAAFHICISSIMTNNQVSSPSTSSRLLEVLDAYERVLVVMHDNPDPDAIASGWAIEVLVHERLQKPVRVIAGGAIVRAENRYMVELLHPPIELVDDIFVDGQTATILVDCGLEATNHLLTRHNIKPVGIIDHHVTGNGSLAMPFTDIRPNVAASAMITASYLQEQGIDPGAKLATAMLYAVRTETCGHETHFSQLDRTMLTWLTEFGEPELLAEIQNAPLTRDYFADLLLALQSTFLYGDVAICFLPRAAGVEIVGEVADMLVRCDDIRSVLCAAIVGDDLLISARTSRDSDSAVLLLQKTLHGLGGAGGHSHRAGGKVSGIKHGARATDNLYDQLHSRWLSVCDVTRQRGSRLIAKHEIVQNLHR
ncbi:putative manganese-dependent inorganic pyrophosphatase [Planctomycetes bacterium CA13]|uniref:Putative manganese-dependent inorganic pyrophosphatase n=1 Tax=Novipirellula herctigrandis TaxID=2527986 RepID=A0A5C5YY02_9BACT|nr:putative manganese-dependent inorganic pyrophosphatase [Planctomycetes bacterium CA13]